MGTGGVASVNYGNDKFAYSTDTWAFRSNDEDELKAEFIYRALQQKLSKIDYRAFEGSGLKHLRKKDVKKLLIRAPVNKVVTEKILTILRKTDQAIENYKKAADNAEELDEIYLAMAFEFENTAKFDDAIFYLKILLS